MAAKVPLVAGGSTLVAAPAELQSRYGGVAWSVTQVLALVTLALVTAATWGLFTKAGWWEAVAVVAAAVGFAVLAPYWVAAHHAGEVNPEFNVLVHALGSVGVLVLLLVPTLERWVDGHVLAGS